MNNNRNTESVHYSIFNELAGLFFVALNNMVQLSLNSSLNSYFKNAPACLKSC